MNIDQLKESGWIIFSCISGSRAYGLNVEGSDVDIRGVFIQPTDQRIGLTGQIDQVSCSNNDIVYYEIGKFIELLSKANPNLIEMLFVDDEFILKKEPTWDDIFTDEVKNSFLTKKLKHTFTGYAYSQIKKARGLNKKIMWDEQKVAIKSILHFCYSIGVDSPEDSQTLLLFQDKEYLDQIGLAKVNNVPDLYSMYKMPEGVKGGFFNKGSNDVQLRSIPKGAPFIGYMRFDKNGYSQHCKDYNEYQKWLENRNELRFKTNALHGKGYDSKNMMHTLRLLYMATDIADGKGVVVKRSEDERRILLEIRKGEYAYEYILDSAETIVDDINMRFEKSDLPRSVNMRKLNKLLTKIRLCSIEN